MPAKRPARLINVIHDSQQTAGNKPGLMNLTSIKLNGDDAQFRRPCPFVPLAALSNRIEGDSRFLMKAIKNDRTLTDWLFISPTTKTGRDPYHVRLMPEIHVPVAAKRRRPRRMS
jgi:hypothetical protein